MSDDDDNSSSSLDSGRSDGSSPPTPTPRLEKPEKLLENNVNEDSGSDSDRSSKKSHNNSKQSGSHSGSSSSSDSGSGSSSDSSDHSDEEKEDKSDAEDNSGGENDGERSRSSGSRSRSRSDSGSGSSRSHSGSEESDKEGERQGDINKLWQRDPDFYGIRRSSRNRSNSHSNSKPPKLVAQIRTPSTAKRPTVKKTARKRKISTEDDDESSDEEQTRCVRKRGTAVISYKEDESDDDEMSANEDDTAQESQNGGEPAETEEQFETIERIMDIRQGKRGATGSATTIYAVEERGDPQDSLPEDADMEAQFFIKWVGWSHLHNTWESLETIQEMKAKGLKKLDNYCKKEDELARWRSYASPEDTEYYECQLELQQELAKAYTKVERIISEHKAPDGQAEFFVKWECLPYSDATWENGALIRKRNTEAIEIFKAREASNRTPTSSKNFRYRPKFSQIKSQPDHMKGESKNLILRDYQLDGLNWLVHSWCKENSVILADEMGLGKTIQTICFLSYLFETCKLYGPYLIVVPLSTMAAWQKEFGQWAPQINVVTYLGDISSRDIIREYEWSFPTSRRIKFNAILTTYEIVLKDKTFLGAVSWAMLMVDEAHRLKNGDSLLYKTLADFDTNHRLLITGTPLQNSLRELWSLLHFIMPNKFNDWESFEQEHDHAATKGYAKLHKQLEPFILRRVKKDVEKSLPAKVEQILRVEMTSLQKQYYKWILTKNYVALRRGVKGSVSSFINVVMELKKCCNHAALVKPVESSAADNITSLIKGSGKLMLLDKLLVRLKETGHRVLIFSQMVRMLDIIAEYLQQRRFAFQRLDGSIKGDIRKQALDHFNAEGSADFCFLLSTRAGGLGINLATADTVIIFDSDWNPQNDLQAQARAHRIGQKNQVNIYRLVTKNSVEEDIVERAKQKMVLDHLVIQRMDTTGRTVLDKGNKSGTPFNKEELTAILKFGAEELFKEDDNDGDDQCDIDEILRRAETHEEAARPGEELLSAFKVASFNVNEEEEELSDLPGSTATPESKDWDQIIPEDIRKKVEDEEREKEMADLYLPPRSSRNQAAADGKDISPEDTSAKKGRKRRKRDESEESDSDSGRPKKRGRPTKAYTKEKIKGFTDSQIRKFVKSFKRFPKPHLRIEALAKDANLAEKSLAELKKLAETLMQRCNAAVEEYKVNPTAAIIKEESASNTPAQSEVGDGPTTPGADAKKKKPPKDKGPSFKMAGVMVNAKTLTSAIEELAPLGEVIPKDDAARKAWKLDLKTKTALYDSEWGPEEDTRLLVGIWEHGMGNWEAIRESDPVLKEKIFAEGDKKPQFKHVCTRGEYLIKVIKKHLALTQPTTTKVRKKRADKKKDAADIKPEPGAVVVKEESTDVPKEDNAPKDAKSKVKKPRKKKDPGPMHFSAAADPTPRDMLGELDPRSFNECKEKMRPVKKALKSLDNPDPNLTEKEQVRHTRNCLIQIGDQIQTCLNTYKDPNDVKQWKSHLWYFVSKFTEYDAHKLHKLYRKAIRKDDSDESPSKSLKGKDKNKEKSKDKPSKEKKPKREREPVKNLQENSNSSHSDLQGSKNNSQYRDRNRDRDRGGFDFRDNDRVPPTGDSFSSAPNFRKGYHTVNGGYDLMPAYHGYRDSRDRDRAPGDPRDMRDRAPGDPRDNRAPGDPRGERAPGDPRESRGGHQQSKAYYQTDRDRGPPNDRGRPWGGNSKGGRWSGGGGGGGGGGGSGHYPPTRRDGTAASMPPYYSGGQCPPPPTIGGPPVGYPAAPPPPHHLGRIAPPLSQDEWRRSDPKRQNNNNSSKTSTAASTSGGSSTSGGRRHDGYEKY